MSWKEDPYKQLWSEIKLGNLQKIGLKDHVLFECKICKCVICGMTQANDHVVGVKHYKTSMQKLQKLTHEHSDSSDTEVSSSEGHINKYFKIENDSDFSDIRKHSINIRNRNTDKSEEKFPSISQDDTVFCEVCKLSVTGTAPMQQHLAGKPHKRKLQIEEANAKRSDTALGIPSQSLTSSFMDDKSEEKFASISQDDTVFCEVCKLSVTGTAPMQQHLAGKPHKRKLQIEEANAKQSGTVPGIPSQSLTSSFMDGKKGIEQKPLDTFSCELCCLSFTGDAPKQQHLNGKAHRRRLPLCDVTSSLAPNPVNMPSRSSCSSSSSSSTTPPPLPFSNTAAESAFPTSSSSSYNSDFDSENLIYVIENGIKNEKNNATFQAPIRIVEANQPIPKLF